MLDQYRRGRFFYHYCGHKFSFMWAHHKSHHHFANPSPFAVIADGVMDNLFLWVMLMLKRYDYLARHLVDFRGRSHEERVAHLQGLARKQRGRIPGIFEIERPETVAATRRATTVPVELQLAAE